jgi:hypothetical protein
MTELIWEGKYVNGKRQYPVRVALPFQTIETVMRVGAAANRGQAKTDDARTLQAGFIDAV